MDSFMQTLEEFGRNPVLMKWAGGIILALLALSFVLFRRHPMKNAVAFGGGILGIIIVLSIIKYALS